MNVDANLENQQKKVFGPKPTLKLVGACKINQLKKIMVQLLFLFLHPDQAQECFNFCMSF
jgi:hypothetical protein